MSSASVTFGTKAATYRKISRSLRRNSERNRCCATLELSNGRLESADIRQSLPILPANHEFWTSNHPIVVMECSAPLFVNVSQLSGAGHSMQWESDLIGYDALNYGPAG